eukprot:GILJ01016049.1.p1 GENE.GILJ01016049.1~~GILJ01016049.1.p1  ORF type:complete len:682 (+),score=96.30 GILJ01016049.1:47-2047(+)
MDDRSMSDRMSSASAQESRGCKKLCSCSGSGCFAGCWSVIKEQATILREQERKEAEETTSSSDGSTIPKSVGLRKAFKLIGPEFTLVLVGTILALGNMAINLLVPMIFGKLYDELTQHPNMDDAWYYCKLLLILSVATLITNTASQLLFTKATVALTTRLRESLLRSLLAQDISFHDGKTAGELNSRIANDTNTVNALLNRTLDQFLGATLNVIGGTVLMFVTDWRLGLVGVFYGPLWLSTSRKVGQISGRYGRYINDVQARSMSVATEALGNIRVVQAFVGEEKEQEAFHKRMKEFYDLNMKINVFRALVQWVIALINDVITDKAVIVLGAYLIVDKQITLGQYLAFRSYMCTAHAGLAQMMDVYIRIQESLGSSQRFFELLERKPRIPVEGGLIPDYCEGKLEFVDVRFSYPTRPDMEILKGINLRINPDEILALVGASGNGKSTLVKLVDRFYDPCSGRILLDNVDIREINIYWYRRHIGYVEQEPLLFARSIAENIAYGVESTTEEEIERAAKIANAHEFIRGFPEGYVTDVGERGIHLSGGQKQRIALARAVLKNAPILILDEATSALDSENEFLVQQALDRLMVGRTTIIIAHRLSTIRRASSIAVIENGLIMEQGPHETLLTIPSGRYSSFVSKQLMGKRQEEDGSVVSLNGSIMGSIN